MLEMDKDQLIIDMASQKNMEKHINKFVEFSKVV